MQNYPKLPRCATTFAVQIAVIISVFAMIPSTATSAEPAMTTKIYCHDPEVPTLVLTVDFPRDAAVIKHALRTEVCRYTDEPMLVTPVFFLRRVKTTPGSAEPFGYIWAIRLVERELAYWFFWKDEHETMLKRAPSI